MAETKATFTCAQCRGTFSKESSDEEMMIESERLFGHYPPQELDVVCDDCWNKMGFGELAKAEEHE